MPLCYCTIEQEIHRRPGVVFIFALLALSQLQGCAFIDKDEPCRIDAVYGLIRVNGKTGLTKEQLDQAKVKLCARHTGATETYEGEGACSTPEKVFPDGTLPDIMTGDSQALLLIVCPTNTYPSNKDIQRVICNRNVTGGLSLHFDDYSTSADCRSPEAAENAAAATVPAVTAPKDGASAGAKAAAVAQPAGTVAPVDPPSEVPRYWAAGSGSGVAAAPAALTSESYEAEVLLHALDQAAPDKPAVARPLVRREDGATMERQAASQSMVSDAQQ